MAITKGPRGPRQLGDMHEKGHKSAGRRQKIPPGQKWWKMSDSQVPGALVSTVQTIKKERTALDQEMAILSRLYCGKLPGSTYGTAHHHNHGLHPSLTGRLTYNIMAIVIDTLMSKITKDNLSVQFLTTGGDYRQQRRAKKLSQFADGITYETKMDDKGADVFRDATVAPVGIIHTYPDWITRRVKSERVLPQELYVDYIDGFYGEPTQMHRVKLVDREQLIESFPEHEKEIINCNDSAAGGLLDGERTLSDMVAVLESWHLPSAADADDGRHLVYISNCVLTPEADRKYTKMRFPFSVYRWKNDMEGWGGIPLARDLVGSQVEMNHLLIMFQRSFRMMAAFRIWIETGTIPDQHFQDKVGTILHGPKGSQPPQFLTPPALNDQYFRYFDGIRARAFEAARLSQLSASGQKPAGLNSGEAQRVYHDIENEGFSYAAKQYEQFRLDVVNQQVDCVRDIFEKEKEYRLRSPVSSNTIPGFRFLRSIDWKSVRLEEDEYILRAYPISSLPNTPAGRRETVQDLLRAGLIDQETGRKLLNFTDLAQVQSLLGAAEDWIMSCLDSIVEDGKYRAPDPYMNLAMAEKIGVQEYSFGSANNMEDDKLEMLDNWISQVRRLKAVAVAALNVGIPGQMPVGAVPGGAVQGVGAPAPVSPMLPPGAQA